MINKPFTIEEYEASRLKLNNCPFCGGIEQELLGSDDSAYWASCQCGAEGKCSNTEKEAIAAWNKPGGRIKELESMPVFSDELMEACKNLDEYDGTALGASGEESTRDLSVLRRILSRAAIAIYRNHIGE